VVSARTEHGVRLEDGVARRARNRLKQLVKEMEEKGETRGRGQTAPLLVEHLVRISDACPDNLRGIRDRPMVLMHFAVAGREHELAYKRVRELRRDPRRHPDLRVSKVRPRVVLVPYGSRPLHLPGEGLAGLEGGRRPHRAGRLRLVPAAQTVAHRPGGRAAAPRRSATS
jgi:hypothetical protein